MIRRIDRVRWLGVVAVVAVLLTGCSDADVVATVNGEPIYEADVLAMRPEYQADMQDGRVDGDAFRQDLTQQIYRKAFEVAFKEDFGLDPPSAEEIRRFLDNPPQRYEASIARGEELGVSDEAFAVFAAQALMRETAVIRLIDQEVGLADLFASDPTAVTTACVAHILVATEAEAQQVLARLQAGEAFGELAQELSLDTASPEGVILDERSQSSCVRQANSFVPRFGDAVVAAPIQEPFGPFETTFGWHVILVIDRRSPSTEQEFLADPVLFLDPNIVSDAASLWFDAAVSNVEVDVRSKVGGWNPRTDGIPPPDDGIPNLPAL